MIKLKRRIKRINSLPDEEKKKFSIKPIIVFLLNVSILSSAGYFVYIKVLPYINSVDINKITGKKVYYTDCNTKDYIYINKDKSFSLSLTDKECETKYIEGNIIIKNNEITFNDNISGTIDNDYNLIIDGNKFEDEKDESRT